jgi:hypothetical protein
MLFHDYFLSCNFWTVNPGKPPQMRSGILARLGYRLLTIFTVGLWLIERFLHIKLPASRFLSPYIVSIWRVGDVPASPNSP